MKQVNEKVVTVQDCIDMYEKKEVVGFVEKGVTNDK